MFHQRQRPTPECPGAHAARGGRVRLGQGTVLGDPRRHQQVGQFIQVRPRCLGPRQDRRPPAADRNGRGRRAARRGGPVVGGVERRSGRGERLVPRFGLTSVAGPVGGATFQSGSFKAIFLRSTSRRTGRDRLNRNSAGPRSYRQASRRSAKTGRDHPGDTGQRADRLGEFA